MNYDVKGMISKLNGMGAEVNKAVAQALYSTALQTKALAVAKHTPGQNAPSRHKNGGNGFSKLYSALRAIFNRDKSISAWISAEYKGEVAGRQTAMVISNSPHSAFVEFGTGPEGAAHHGGISPEVSPSYTTAFYVRRKRSKRFGQELIGQDGKPFWYYHVNGAFFATSGQPARPYMYPASKEAEPILPDEMDKAIKRILK